MNAISPHRRVALYARVSTTRQAEADLSIPDQVHQTLEFCRQRRWDIIEQFIEPGASGTDDRRPVFQRMIEAATGLDRPFDVILVHSMSQHGAAGAGQSVRRHLFGDALSGAADFPDADPEGQRQHRRAH
jgi:DNA invertase Pin-like site-specific DNA recombinase